MTGFTIFELIVSMAVAAVLAALALPSFAEFIDDNRLRGVATELVSDLNLARAEAIKRNARVLVCPKVGNSNCASNANVKWNEGWIVCYDADADGKCDAGTDSDPNPIRSVNPMPAGVTLEASAADVRYTATGSTTGQVVWDLAGSTSKVKRTITAAGTGSVSLLKK
ncbi:MAG TPA: GspH/FimT family pseudopilin [Burkholderiales bacterium]|nr:GspH/FimT family pseudopilin [Burkholderiales bacterium]